MLKIKEQFIKAKEFIRGNEVANKALSNSGWLIGNRMFTMLLGIGITAVVARYFSPEKYGQFNYALAFIALFTAISALGLETLTVKAIVDNTCVYYV